jgi:hypothetical protein
MREQLKNFLNEDQDPKAIEKITSKLENLLMKNEEVGYIGVQKKPAITVFPDSIVVTNKRIIMCKPKNLGLSMDFVDYDWDDITGTFVKENILGSDFSFSTKTELVINIDYIPKNQARKLHTFAKEQISLLKNPITENIPTTENKEPFVPIAENAIPLSETEEIIEDVETEEVVSYTEIIPVENFTFSEKVLETPNDNAQNTTFTKEDLFEKLQNYKKLLDNGLILQGEYDAFKKEILSQM